MNYMRYDPYTDTWIPYGESDTDRLINLFCRIRDNCSKGCRKCPFNIVASAGSFCQIQELVSAMDTTPNYWDMNEIREIMCHE